VLALEAVQPLRRLLARREGAVRLLGEREEMHRVPAGDVVRSRRLA
jgi:hypothetical protein